MEGVMMTKLSNPDYLARARKLSEEEAERLLSRMSGKLPHRLQKNKLNREEALAIQLELEDEQLEEWRSMMQTLRKKEADKQKAAKAAAAKKGSAVDKAAEKQKEHGKTGAVAKSKSVTQSATAAKRKTAAKARSVETTKAEKSHVPK